MSTALNWPIPVSAAASTTMATDGSRGRYLAVFQYSFAMATLVSPAFFAALQNGGHSLPFVVLEWSARPALSGCRELAAGA